MEAEVSRLNLTLDFKGRFDSIRFSVYLFIYSALTVMPLLRSDQLFYARGVNMCKAGSVEAHGLEGAHKENRPCNNALGRE